MNTSGSNVNNILPCRRSTFTSGTRTNGDHRTISPQANCMSPTCGK